MAFLYHDIMGHEYWYYFVPLKEGTDIKEFEEHLNEYDEWSDDKEERDIHFQYLSEHAPRYKGECEYAWVNTRWLDDFTYCYWEEIDKYFKDVEGYKIVKKIDKKFKDGIKEIMMEGTGDNRKLTCSEHRWIKILEFIIDNYGGYCYHYVY